MEWHKTEQEETEKFRELMTVFCRGDREAVQLAEDLLYITHVWDDLYDRDKERTTEEINICFTRAMAHIPLNFVYQQNVRDFGLLSLLTALTWQIANRFEDGNEDELIGSFILRNTLLVMIYFIILLSGARRNDDNWGIRAGEKFFREMFKGYADKYKFFLTEMGERK